MQLEGSKVLLTGASGGIGKAIARALCERGARLAITARREEVLSELCSELTGDLTPLPADLAEAGAPADLAERAGEVDVLVANAALPAAGRVDDFSPEEIDRAIDVNLRAPIQLARLLLPGMMQRGRGHLVFISSLSGKTASPGSGLYSAAKFGLRGFAAGVREDLVGTGVGVTVVFPGFIRDAGMFADSGLKLRKGVGTSTAEDVAAGVVRGIESGKGEIDVAPLGMRLSVKFAELAPSIGARIQRRLGAVEVSEQLADAHRRDGKL
ncbi:MAG TPA: SDR family NAD(P)-dependent oxidoreductase [Thermoleophilaceae bacterium]|nr:SDR family NAD(P)-dependent oxidoreductase [Thermoleophilaceae bacterium]